jgi:hypothetical protein
VNPIVGYILGVVVVGVLINIFAAEAIGWMPKAAQRLLDRAGRQLPEDHRERWIREWEGDMAAFSGRPIAGLIYALKISRSVPALARELAPAAVAVGAERTRQARPPRRKRVPAGAAASIGTIGALRRAVTRWVQAVGRRVSEAISVDPVLAFVRSTGRFYGETARATGRMVLTIATTLRATLEAVTQSLRLTITAITDIARSLRREAAGSVAPVAAGAFLATAVGLALASSKSTIGIMMLVAIVGVILVFRR